MTTVLITGIGGDIAQCVATIVRESAGASYKLVGCDTHDQHGGKLYVDTFRPVPRAGDAVYVESLMSLVKAESVDIVIPMSEPELDVLCHVMSEHSGVHWITPGPQVIKVGVDKLLTAQALASAGIAMPWTQPVSAGLPPAYPCIVKERRGSGSRAVFRANNREEAEYLSARHPDAIYQEYLYPDDGEVTCAIYRTRDDRVAILQLSRRLVGGFTGWARVIQDPAIQETCVRAAHALNLRGSMNIQLRMTVSGPRVFEINPRFSSTVLMRHRIGFSDVTWSLQETAGLQIEFPRIPAGTTIVRTQGAAVIN